MVCAGAGATKTKLLRTTKTTKADLLNISFILPCLQLRVATFIADTSRAATCQPKPVAHGIKCSKPFVVAQNAVPPVPLTSENQNH